MNDPYLESIEELKQRLAKLNKLLENPQPGLATWTCALCGKMDELCAWWTQEEP